MYGLTPLELERPPLLQIDVTRFQPEQRPPERRSSG